MTRLGRQQVEVFDREISKRVNLNYLLHLPENYQQETGDLWPLILFLHGAGERGSNIEDVKKHGIPRVVEEGTELPFITVSPQCKEGSWWDLELDGLMALLDDITARYAVDTNAVYLTGLSMGGFGTWALAMEDSKRFAAIAPICGGGRTEKLGNLKDIPTWVFHGAKDKVVPIERSEQMVRALQSVGGNVEFTVYPDAEHDSWTETYNNPKLYEWFLSHRKTDA